MCPDPDTQEDKSDLGEAIAGITKALAGLTPRQALRVIASVALALGHYEEARRAIAKLERMPDHESPPSDG